MRINKLIIIVLISLLSLSAYGQTKKITRQGSTVRNGATAKKLPPKRTPRVYWETTADSHEGLVVVYDYNGRHGYMDKTGKLVISSTNISLTSSFSEGLARVQDYRDENGKYGFIDKTGKLILPCKWYDVESFSEGLALVSNERCFINKQGKVVVKL